MRWNIHNVLVIAEKQTFGACLGGVLRGHGCRVTIVESYGRFSDVFQGIARRKFDLVIATNTSLPATHIQSIVPDIKARHPHARIIVLSGYYPGDFVADLNQQAIDGFLPLPYEEDALLKEVAGLLSKPTP
jgi:DNA-binding NtrC family response regulator